MRANAIKLPYSENNSAFCLKIKIHKAEMTDFVIILLLHIMVTRKKFKNRKSSIIRNLAPTLHS